jgi:uncharacterized protein
MVGTILNVIGILAGGVAGLTMKKPLSPANQMFLKLGLGVGAVAIGLRLTWVSVNGSFGQILKQLFIVVLALTIGKLIGQLCRLQKLSNHLGQYAGDKFQAARPDAPNRFNDGFVVCSILFCVAPLAVIGAALDGLSGFYLALLLKAVMDGLGVMSFVPAFGWGTLLAALPVIAFQGLITLGVRLLAPWLSEHGLVDSINATGGLLVFCVALIILQIKKIELANYLPSLAAAPVITWLWR